MIVMNLLKIENICYSKTFFMRKNTFFIHFVIVILIFKVLITILFYSLQKKRDRYKTTSLHKQKTITYIYSHHFTTVTSITPSSLSKLSERVTFAELVPQK
jgi:hypothetical protein